MNLGDGLLFELENGKPRLILLNHAGAEKKPAKLSTTLWKTPVGQRSRQASRLEEEELQREEVTVKCREARRKTRQQFTAAGTSSTSSTHDAPGRSGTKPLTSRNTPKANHLAVGGAKVAPRISDNRSKNMPSGVTNCKTGLPPNEDTAGLDHNRLNSLANGVAGLKEGVVYLTNQQLQQIISSIQNSTNQSSEEEQHWQGCDSTMKEAAGEVEGERSPDSRTGISEEKENNVLIWLGDRETESRVSQTDKKTRWRRELDEQVAVKQNRVAAERQDGDGALSVQCSARELPAVFKSNFRRRGYTEESIKGEDKREEERRRWLEQLDRQKMEDTMRRRQEKDLLSQTEDYEHWAMHFDSLHRRTPVPLPTSTFLPPTTLSSSSTLPTAPGRGAARVESEMGRVPSTSLSLVWDNLSSCGGGAESVGRASVDTAAGYTNRHTRTMTALLDPAQIEERERRRTKQLEQKRAIEAQVEERRQQREREEEMRREQEMMEERRVEEERRELQRQHELNTLRERQKEEKQFIRQQLLYESVQSAQQEALSLKQKQRLTELTRRGHDVGRLLESIAHNGNGVEERLEEVAGAEKTAEEEKTIVSPCRDISVQTEVSPPECLQTAPPPAPPGRRNQNKQNPRLPGVERDVEREGGEKRGERRGGEKTAGDPYERFARTDDSSKRVKRRPDWNVNRPSGSFVPASERYPPSLQRSRQEARLRRQADLLALQERSCQSRTDDLNPGHTSNLGQGRCITNHTKEVDRKTRELSVCPSIHSERGHSPPVPAVRLGQRTRPHSDSSRLHPDLSTTPPSQLDFVPYIRTDEVYQLHTPHTEPLQMSSPTHLPSAPRLPSAPHPRTERGRPPPLHNKNTNAHTHRQQEILRGLAQLRQGLLQKQRELESSLNPHDNHLSSYQ